MLAVPAGTGDQVRSGLMFWPPAMGWAAEIGTVSFSENRLLVTVSGDGSLAIAVVYPEVDGCALGTMSRTVSRLGDRGQAWTWSRKVGTPRSEECRVGTEESSQLSA